MLFLGQMHAADIGVEMLIAKYILSFNYCLLNKPMHRYHIPIS